MTSLHTPASQPTASPRLLMPVPPRWLREPFVHFLLLGVVLFGLDHAFLVHRDDPRTIVVGPDVDREAAAVFEAARGRDPDVAERDALRRVWLDNEVLYREGLAMQVDRGDPAIRERVIFKALSVVDANVKLPPLDDRVLRPWFEQHRSKYDEPERYDFEEAALAGTPTEESVRSFVAALNGGAPGDAEAGLRVFKGRPRDNLAQSYGNDFPAALGRLAPRSWTALPTKDGWRAVRLDAVIAAKPATFETLRPTVVQDWTDAVLSEQRSAAVQALARHYTIRRPEVAR